MDRGEPQQETIGELFSRLVDEGRALIGAELSLFRLDFYQRIARAKIGIVMCLVGVIMGQAAAVTLLISIAYALTPWLGGFGGAAVAAVLGGGAAILLLRMGAKRLTLIVDDEPEEPKKKTTLTMDQLFERARARSQASRSHLADAIGDAQTRLNPHALALELWEEIADKGQEFAHQAVDMLRRRPLRSIGFIIVAALVIIRPPIGKMIARIAGKTGATESERSSLKRKRAGRPSRLPSDEETTS